MKGSWGWAVWFTFKKIYVKLKVFHIHGKLKVAQLCPTLCNPMDCSPPWNFLGKNTGVGCHSLIQGIFLSQGSNLGLPRCRQILYLLSRQGNTFNISFAFIYLSGCVRLRHMGALLCYGGYFFVAHRPSSCSTWTLVAVAHGL